MWNCRLTGTLSIGILERWFFGLLQVVSGDHVTGFDRLDMRVLSGYPLRTPFSLSPQSYLCGRLGVSFIAFSRQSGTSVPLRFPAIFEAAAHWRLQQSRI